MTISISELNIFPVKSLGGITLDTADLTLPGLRFDRRWMVVAPDGRFITQRTCPQMAMVETRIVNDQLALASFGMDDHLVPYSSADMSRLSTEVWGDAVNAMDVGDETAAWLSQALGEECRLVVFPQSETRYCDGGRAKPDDHTHFADGFPLLIVSQASLDDLNNRLDTPVEMKRFRPNIVVSGCDAFAEDSWQSIEVGGISIRIVDGCPRCSVPTVDPSTGMLSGPEPIHTLSSYRERDGEVYFGVNAAADREGPIAVGDTVTVVN